MDKIEIKNASIIDGLGGEPYFGNIYLYEGKISAITHGESLDSDISIDASGKIVTPGYAADIVIMNLPNVKENATFENLHQYPSGISHVIVNGEIVIRDEEFTGKTPGKMITNFNS